MLSFRPLCLLLAAWLAASCSSAAAPAVGATDAQHADQTDDSSQLVDAAVELDAAADGGADTSDAADSADAASEPTTATLPAEQRAALNNFVVNKLAAAHVPGCAAGIVKGGKLAWQSAWGLANVAQNTPATPQNLHMLASISKTATAVGVMRAVELGLVNLDDDLNTWLPFAVHHPKFPKTVITLRLLLTHFAGISDNWDVMDATYVDGDSPVALGDFLHDYLATDGKYYDAAANFGTKQPGTKYDYSDIGISLAGYAVELKTKVPFDQWCTQEVFAPLGLTQTSFRLKGLDASTIAMPYGWSKADGFTPYGLYGYPDYPDGALRSSVGQMARFLLMFMNDGSWSGVQVLKTATVAEMKKVQYPTLDQAQLLTWYSEVRDDGKTYIGHNGGDRGIWGQMFYRPGDGVGVLLFCNGDVDQGTAGETAVLAIETRLYQEAKSL